MSLVDSIKLLYLQHHSLSTFLLFVGLGSSQSQLIACVIHQDIALNMVSLFEFLFLSLDSKLTLDANSVHLEKARPVFPVFNSFLKISCQSFLLSYFILNFTLRKKCYGAFFHVYKIISRLHLNCYKYVWKIHSIQISDLGLGQRCFIHLHKNTYWCAILIACHLPSGSERWHDGNTSNNDNWKWIGSGFRYTYPVHFQSSPITFLHALRTGVV